MKRKCNKAGLHFKHFRRFQKAERCTRLLGARAGIRWPLQTHSSPVILWEDKHTGRCKSYMKSVTPGPLVGPHIQFWFCTVGEEGSMNNCQLFWYWQQFCYLENEMEKQTKWDGCISVFPIWAARCSKNWYFKNCCHLRENKTMLDVS